MSRIAFVRFGLHDFFPLWEPKAEFREANDGK
jgi:hypothetical protein